MKLNELFIGHVLTRPLPEIEIREITERSTAANEASIFVCIPGTMVDGHTFAPDAYARGCRVFLSQRPLELPADATVIQVSDSRACLGPLAAKLYGPLSPEICLIGITGTKGKTTTAHMISHILNQNAIPTGYIGTNGVSFGAIHRPTSNTTPDPVTLWKTLLEMQAHGIRAVVLEVSSQALMQHRVAGLTFDTVLFTNLFPDHIGPREHDSFDHYKACKKKLFTDFNAGTAIVNADDPYAAEMLESSSAQRILRCGTNAPQADLTADHWHPLRLEAFLGISFDLRTPCMPPLTCRLPLAGRGNVSNALLALACANFRFSIPYASAVSTLSNVSVAGRSQVLPLPNGACAVIDYAHNGESLRQLLITLRDYAPHRILCLFGSIGDRAKLRRRELGLVAAELADLCILTSDNPGQEDPEQILEEIAAAFIDFDTPYLKITDRKEAIEKALKLLLPGDILLLAGKGHETYQLIGKQKLPFSEKEIIEAYVKQSLLPS